MRSPDVNLHDDSRREISFKRDVLTLASGTLVGQLLTVMVSPLLSRLFSPEAFGIFALVTALTLVLVSVSNLEYGSAIVLPEKDEDAANLLAGALGITVLASALSFILLWLFGPALADWLNAPELLIYLWLIPPLILFGGFGTGHPVLNAWAARGRRFTQIAGSRLAGSVATALGKVAAGLAGITSGAGLIGGSVIGAVLAPFLLGRQIWRENGRMLVKAVRLPKIFAILARYRKFAVFNAPSSFLSILSVQTPSFLLAVFFSTTVVGFYSFGYQLLNLPMLLIGQSVSQAFYPHAAAANRQQELPALVERTFRRLIEYSLFPSLMLMLVGKELFSVAFGGQWAEAGVYAQILSVWLLFWLISMPLSQLINVLEQNEFYFRWNLITLATRVASIWLGAQMGSPVLAMIFLSLSGACIYAYISYWVCLKAGIPWKKVGAMLLKNLVIFVPAGAILLIIKTLDLSQFLTVGIATTFTGLYFLFRLKDEASFRSMAARVRAFVTRK